MTGAGSVARGNRAARRRDHPTGTFLYVSNNGDGTVSAFTIDPTTGHLTSVHAAYPTGATTIPSTATPTELAVDPSGQYLYVANGDDGTISVFKITAGPEL